MDAKEIKTCLKSAREAIKNKDFKEVLKQCKDVLTVDKNNYNALVFIGIATEGLDQPDQALKAYRRAAEQNPEQLLAWQGLSGMLEKNPLVMESREAFSVFENLESLNLNGITKQIAYLHKLADLQIKNKEIEKAIDTLQSLLALIKEEEERIKILKTLLSLLAQSAHTLSQDRLLLYKENLNVILQSSFLTQEDILKNTQRLLLVTLQTNMNNLESVAEELKNRFPTAAPPVEFLLQNYLDKSICDDSSYSKTCDLIKDLTTQLATLNASSVLITAGQGFLLLQDKHFLQARDILQGIDSNCICGHYFLCQAYIGLHMYQQCLDACNRAIDMITVFKIVQANAYKAFGTEEARDSGLTILKEIQERKPHEAFLIKAYICLDQGKFEEAQKCVEHLGSDSLAAQTLTAAVHFGKREYEKALQLLQIIVKKDPTDQRATLLLGKVLWELRDSKECENAEQNCYTTLLKAAKQDPYNYESFQYLGYFYKTVQQDTVKARRCFQKAYDLNPRKEETGCALVDALVELQEEAQSLKILETVTREAAAGSAKWAWLRLGLHQIKHENPTMAIMSLQSAMRADPNDCHVWECLADAYLQHGSLTASLKAFIKASEGVCGEISRLTDWLLQQLCELNPQSLYCLYQIASIKQTLGSLSEAIQEYKHILDKSENYAPALKGVGESLIHLGKHNLNRCLDGLAKDNFEEAIGYLTSAVSQRSDLSCLWKLMGDASTLVYCLSADSFSLPSKLVNKGSHEHSMKSVTKAELLQIGASCYNQAVKILPESGALWHDLGVNLYYQSQLTIGSASHKESTDGFLLLQRATKAIRVAIDLEPKDWRHWNVLGVIACSKLDHKPALAQHCFIKSIECESSNVIAWTNLGTLYLSKGETELAHDAFSAAQSVDPTCMTCWIGQALIAGKIGHQEEAMDLFRHTTELGFHPESALGYGQWVLNVLGDNSKRDSEYFQYCIHQMAAVPAASDALSRYIGRVKTDPVAYNMQGLLLEHQNLLQSSVAALQRALTLLEQSDPRNIISDVRLNLAQVLCKHGQYEESVKQFELCDLSSSVEHICMYGLALFRCDRLVDSFKVYQHALELLGDSQRMSQLYTALGMVAYRLSDMEAAKTQLFDGFQTTQPSPKGLLALCALGLLQNDLTLAIAVLEELFKREDREKFIMDILQLQMYRFIIQADLEKAEAHLREATQAYACNASLWSLLAVLILTQDKDRGAVIAECALSAVNLLGSGSGQRELVLQSLGQLLAGHHHRQRSDGNALKTAQKAFHLNPGCQSALSTLVCAVHAEAVIRRALTGEEGLLKVEKGFLNVLMKSENLNDELEKWCLQQLVVNSIEGSDVSSAQGFFQLLMDKDQGSPDTEVFAKSITMYMSSTADETMLTGNLQKLPMLVICALYCHSRKYEEAVMFLQKLIEQDDLKRSPSVVKNIQERAVHVAYSGLQDQPDNTSLKERFDGVVKYLKGNEIPSAVSCLLQAMIAVKDNKRLAKHLSATALDQIDANSELGYSSSVARQTLVALLWDSKTTSDQQLIEALMNDAREQGDSHTIGVYQKLSNKK